MAMTDISIPLRGEYLHPDPGGALFWPDQGWLLVADLHLGKGSAYARFGQLLPPYDTAATLDRLEAACRRWQPRRVICLGDSFHDRAAAARLEPDAGRRIAALTQAYEWLWLTGNHDPAPPLGWGGGIAEELVAGPLVLRHAADPTLGPESGEISGHFHPKAVTLVRGRHLACRCFISDGRRLILPAFGAYTGGLNVLDPAISGLFPRPFQVWMLGRDRLHRLGRDRLHPDRATRMGQRALQAGAHL